MQFYEFGKKNTKTVMFIHGNLMTWRQFSDIYPLLENEYHVIIVGLDGFDDKENTTYPGFEGEANRLSTYIKTELDGRLDILFGESLGCGPAVFLSKDDSVQIGRMVLSGPEYMSYGIFNRPLIKIMPKRSAKIINSLKGKNPKAPFYLKKVLARDENSMKKIFEKMSLCATEDSIRVTWEWGLKMYSILKSWPPQTKTRVSVWYGEKEHNMKKARKELHRLYPDMQENCFAGFGHGEIIDHPNRLVNELNKFAAE